MKIKKYLLLVSLIVPSIYGFAQNAYTLQEATDYAIQHSIQRANIDIDLAHDDAKIKEYRAMGLPQLKAEGQYQRFINIPTQMMPDFISPAVYGVLMQEGLIAPKAIDMDGTFPVQFGSKNNASASATLSQLVFSGSYIVAIEASKQLKELTKTQITTVERDIRRNVAKAYFTVLVVKENKSILEKNIQLLERSIFETKEYYKNGFVEKLDIDKLQLTLNTILTQLENTEKQLELAQNVLKFQMSMDLNSPILLSDRLEDFDKENVAILNDESEYRNEFKTLEVSKKLTQLNLKRYKLDRYPTVAAYLNAGVNRQSNKFDYFNPKSRWYPTTIFGVNISVNLYDSGTRKALTQQTQLDLKKIENAILLTRQGISLEKSKAKTDYENALNTLKSTENNLALAEDIYNKTRIKYKEGVGSSIEVTQAESSVFQLQASYINALYQLIISQIDLRYAYGLFDKNEIK